MFGWVLAAIGVAVGGALIGYKGRMDEAALERKRADSALAQKVMTKKTDINKKATNADGGVDLKSVDYSTLSPYANNGSGSEFIKDPSLFMSIASGVVNGVSTVAGGMIGGSGSMAGKTKSAGGKVVSTSGSME